MDALVGTLGGLGCVGLGVLLMRRFEPSGDSSLDAYGTASRWRGGILVVFGAAAFVLGILVQIGAVGPE